ncbi:transcriptional regulator, LysR family [Sorangium cellulosum So ce56]|uniref:Transcriptional regulator, LysR family n=1 Tax=Sorangium cellulosum (strain So ce56) TaxID=448385 RepID=A9FD11_SORC5|nr:LysR family transcriptional regulator [Sorangium cellulosum]CAN91716.1 transcriptional regulator, LysR family [Sorangium cellulosum So ce56]
MDARIDLDLNDAALLVRVVRTRSFSAAARERGVPVSTVSRRIARLESALGVRLLERTTRRLDLTEAGRAYFGHAERAIDDLTRGTHHVRELQSEPRGRVRIVAPVALGAAVASAVCAYLAKHPRVSVDLEIDSRRVDLLAGGFDIAIVPGHVDDTTDFVARELWRATRKLLYASPSYLEARGVPQRIEDLARHDCIAVHATDGMATWTLGQGRRRRRVAFEPRFYVSESSAAYRATLAGVGIALLPEVFCAEDVAAKRLVRVLKGYEAEAGGVSLLYRAHRALTAAVRTCIDHLLGELPATDPARAGRGRRA